MTRNVRFSEATAKKHARGDGCDNDLFSFFNTTPTNTSLVDEAGVLDMSSHMAQPKVSDGRCARTWTTPGKGMEDVRLRSFGLDMGTNSVKKSGQGVTSTKKASQHQGRHSSLLVPRRLNLDTTDASIGVVSASTRDEDAVNEDDLSSATGSDISIDYLHPNSDQCGGDITEEDQCIAQFAGEGGMTVEETGTVALVTRGSLLADLVPPSDPQVPLWDCGELPSPTATQSTN